MCLMMSEKGRIEDCGRRRRRRDGELARWLAIGRSIDVEARGDSTFNINRDFVDALVHGDPARLRNTFSSSMNSHAAVIGANISDQLGGRKIALDELMSSDEFAPYRRKPAG